MTTYLALTVAPEIHHHADQIVEPSIRALVHEDTRERQERQHHESELDALV